MSNQMPTQTFEPMPPMPQQPPTKHAVPLTKRKWFLPLVLGAVLLLGVGIGAGDPRTVEVTKEVPVEKIVEKEITVEVPVTPQECLDVITIAGQMMTINGAAFGIMQDNLEAAADLDAARIYGNNDKLKAETAKLDKLHAPWETAIDGCRAG